MIYLFLYVLFAFVTFVVLGFWRYKDIFTKILFLNTTTSLIALLICVMGTFEVNSSYVDIALIYFLLSAIASSAYLKYFINKHKDEQELK